MTPERFFLDVRTATPHFPGIGRYVTGLARAIAALPGAGRVALLHHPDPDRRLPLDRLPGVSCPAGPFAFSQQWVVPRALKKNQASLYHSTYYVMPFASGVPTVVTCYDLIPLTVPGLFDAARRLAFRLAHQLAFRASSTIVVLSQAAARDVCRHFPAQAAKLRVVPPGGDFPGLANGSVEGDAASGLVPEGPFVLAVGSNRPHKDLGVLIDAWWRLCDAKRVRGTLILAGPRDPRYSEGGRAAQCLRWDGRLVSLGVMDDNALAQLYRRASLFVLPSRAEGFGFPALEAMALGAPVVCSEIAALKELCGTAAEYFPPGDADALARVVERLFESPDERDRMRNAGLQRSARFTWAGAARATLAVYESAVGEGR